MKAPPRHSEKSPRELKTREGIERWAGLTPLSVATDRYSDKCPGGEASGTGTGGATRREEKLEERHEGTTRR